MYRIIGGARHRCLIGNGLLKHSIKVFVIFPAISIFVSVIAVISAHKHCKQQKRCHSRKRKHYLTRALPKLRDIENYGIKKESGYTKAVLKSYIGLINVHCHNVHKQRNNKKKRREKLSNQTILILK